MVGKIKKIIQRSKYDRPAYIFAYNIFAPFYDLVHVLSFLFLGGRYKFWRKVINSVDYGHGERILDACCGTGFLSHVLIDTASTDVEVIGIDLSHNQIRLARRKVRAPNVSFQVGDARHIPYNNSYFDKIFITFALHEMPMRVRQMILKELVRVAKNDGRIIVLEGYRPTPVLDRILMFVLFFQWFPWCVDRPHNKEVWGNELVKEIRNCNMIILSREIFNREFFQIIVAKPIKVAI